MEKNNVGGFHLERATTVDAPELNEQLLTSMYQELLYNSTPDSEWRFIAELERFLLNSKTQFAAFYQRSNVAIPTTEVYRFPQEVSYFQKLFPKLKEIPLKVGIGAVLNQQEPYGILIINVPFMNNEKTISLRLLNTEALLIGDYPSPRNAPQWLTLEANKINFIHPVVPMGLRPLIASLFAVRYGWAFAKHVPAQLLLENHKY